MKKFTIRASIVAMCILQMFFAVKTGWGFIPWTILSSGVWSFALMVAHGNDYVLRLSREKSLLWAQWGSFAISIAICIWR